MSAPVTSRDFIWDLIRDIETLMAKRAKLNALRRDVAAHALSVGHREIYQISEEQAEELEAMKQFLIEWHQRLMSAE